MSVFEQIVLTALVVAVWQLVDDHRHRRHLRRPISDLREAYSGS
jgi:hypothetical protein